MRHTGSALQTVLLEAVREAMAALLDFFSEVRRSRCRLNSIRLNNIRLNNIRLTVFVYSAPVCVGVLGRRCSRLNISA